MPLPTIANCYRCSVHQTLGTVDIWNVFHVHSEGTDTPADIGEIVANGWAGTDSFRAMQTDDVNYIEVNVLLLDGVSATVNTAWGTTGAAATGDGGSTGETSVSAMIFTAQTGLGGRSHRGRYFIAGVGHSYIDAEGTRWNNGSPTSVPGKCGNAFIGLVNAALDDGYVAVASYELADDFLVTNMLARPYMGTQRRRAS